MIGFDCPSIYTYITIIQDDGTIRGSFYADKVGSPIPVTYATNSIFLDQTHLYVGYIDNGLGRLRLTIFPQVSAFPGLDIEPIITYGINNNGALNVIYKNSDLSRLYVSGWTDISINTRSAFIMGLRISYPWDLISQCIYSTTITSTTDFYYSPVFV